MSVLEKRPLERVRYWQGQMLRSADFRAQNADSAQHRWWHNRALHNAYGVYQGLRAAAVGTPLSAVAVSPGVGYDGFGRELILESSQTVNLPHNVPPSLPATLVLLMRYAVADDRQTRSNDEICWANAGSSSSGTVDFSWVPMDRVNPCDGVPLGQVIYDGKGNRTLNPKFVPPGSRPIARPAIATGATMPQTTAWQPWIINAPIPVTGANFDPRPVGVKVRVDTSAAGFTRTPCYFAWLVGSLFNRKTGQLLPNMFSSLSEESATGFTFRMWFPRPQQQVILLALKHIAVNLQVIRNPNEFFPFAQQQKLYVEWVASEMPPTVPFVPLRLRILNQWLLPLVLKNVSFARNLIR
jgi:hypothetical protein